MLSMDTRREKEDYQEEQSESFVDNLYPNDLFED
jgi:hypothetical protein